MFRDSTSSKSSLSVLTPKYLLRAALKQMHAVYQNVLDSKRRMANLTFWLIPAAERLITGRQRSLLCRCPVLAMAKVSACLSVCLSHRKLSTSCRLLRVDAQCCCWFPVLIIIWQCLSRADWDGRKWKSKPLQSNVGTVLKI